MEEAHLGRSHIARPQRLLRPAIWPCGRSRLRRSASGTGRLIGLGRVAGALLQRIEREGLWPVRSRVPAAAIRAEREGAGGEGRARGIAAAEICGGQSVPRCFGPAKPGPVLALDAGGPPPPLKSQRFLPTAPPGPSGWPAGPRGLPRRLRTGGLPAGPLTPTSAAASGGFPSRCRRTGSLNPRARSAA